MNLVDSINAWNLSQFDIQNPDKRTPEQIEKDRLERVRLNEEFRKSGKRFYDSGHYVHYSMFNSVSYLKDGFDGKNNSTSDVMYYVVFGDIIHLDYFVRSAKKLGLTVKQAREASQLGARTGSGRARDNKVREFRDKNFGTNEQEQYAIHRKLASKVTASSYANMNQSEKAYYDKIPNVFNFAKQASEKAGKLEEIARELEQVNERKRIIEENKIIEANRIIEEKRIEQEKRIIEEKRIKEEKEKQEQIKNDLEAQQNSFIEPIFKDENIIKKDMGKPESIYNTQEKNIIPEIVKPTNTPKKPETIFNKKDKIDNTITGGVTDYFITIADSLDFTSSKIPDKDFTSDLDNYVEENKPLTESNPIFKTDNTEFKNVSYQVTPMNFKIENGRVIGTVNISSSELTDDKPVLHVTFFPLDMKQNKLSEKINELNFKKDLNETIQINESSKNYENLSINLHVMNSKTKKHLSQQVNIDVLDSDVQEMPVKEKSDKTSLYVAGGIGLIVLALIVQKMRKKEKN